MTNNVKRILCVIVVVFFILCITALPASAHAEVLSTSPNNGEELASSPERVSIQFSEAVDTTELSIQVFNSAGKRIVPTGSVRNHGNDISLSLPHLQPGAYAVTWNVISDDTHPVNGAFSFSVRSLSSINTLPSKSIQKILSESSAQKAPSPGVNVCRFFVFISLAVLISFIFMRTFLVDKMSGSSVRIFYGTLVLSIVVSCVSLVFYSANVGNYSITSAMSYSVLRNEAFSRYGIAALLRVLLCGATFLVWKLRQKFSRVLGVALCVGLASTIAFAGHASAGTYVWLALGMDIVHVFAGTLWLGGLILLPFLITNDNASLVKRFSPIALSCVIAIAITGAFSWWRQIGSIDASLSTWFGHLVSVKTALFLLTVCVAIFSRRFVQRIHDHAENKKKLLWCVYGETVLLTLIFVATSILVSAIPGRAALASPVSRHQAVATGYINITIDPAKVGTTDIHIYMLNKNGTPFQVSDTGASLTKDVLRVTLENKARHSKPIPVTMKFQGLNHFVSVGASLPYAGQWSIKIAFDVAENKKVVTNSDFTVRP